MSKQVELRTIIDVASSAYPDGFVKAWFEQPPGSTAEIGDGLARFIASELTDTYEGGSGAATQWIRAAEVMATAQREIAAVQDALERQAEAATAEPV